MTDDEMARRLRRIMKLINITLDDANCVVVVSNGDDPVSLLVGLDTSGTQTALAMLFGGVLKLFIAIDDPAERCEVLENIRTLLQMMEIRQ